MRPARRRWEGSSPEQWAHKPDLSESALGTRLAFHFAHYTIVRTNRRRAKFPTQGGFLRSQRTSDRVFRSSAYGTSRKKYAKQLKSGLGGEADLTPGAATADSDPKAVMTEPPIRPPRRCRRDRRRDGEAEPPRGLKLMNNSKWSAAGPVDRGRLDP
jgi:hypothetical protein